VNASGEAELRERLGTVEGLIAEIGSVTDPRAEALTRTLLREVLGFHASALARMLEIVREAPAGGAAIVDNIAADPLVASLLVLHGLHPVALETRVRAAVEGVASGWTLSDIHVEGASVRVGFARAAGASSGPTPERLRATIAEQLAHVAPEVEAIHFTGDLEERAPDFVPVERLLKRSAGLTNGSGHENG
jgi:hypothetical protein